MVEKSALTITLTPDERQRIEEAAKARGYADAAEYLRALAEADAEALDEVDPVEGFREGWRDVMTGNTYPVSTLWDDLDDE
jgi:hypothetical protein